jgi:glyceraldehyde 3-phosphate dehydrogenase
MTVRVGINGFGRIGRSFTRALLARGGDAGVELVAVNDPFGDSHTMAFLLKHDSVGGILPNEVKENDGGFSIDGREVKKPVDSTTTSTPRSFHGRFFGSRSAVIWILVPSTTMPSSATSTL